MPKYTIDLTPGAVSGLQTLTARYNADNGTDLAVLDWIHLHLRELAIHDQYVAAAKTFQAQAEKSAADALTAERQRLLDSVA